MSTKNRYKHENRQEDISGSPTYVRRPGTTNTGNLYELYVVCYFILKCIQDDNVTDFKVWINDERCGNFDDVILQKKCKDGTEKKFAIQLKHFNNDKVLKVDALQAEKGDMSIKKYYKSYQDKLGYLKSCRIILWTNSIFNNDNNIEIFTDDKINIHLKVMEVECTSELPSTSGNGKCYRFKMSQPELKSYQDFFDKFLFYPNQQNMKVLKSNIIEILEEAFKDGLSLFSYLINFLTEWSTGKSKMHKLDKSTMEKVIALQLLDSFILPFRRGEYQAKPNGKRFKKVVQKFHVTVIEKELQENVIEIWGKSTEDEPTIEEMNKIRYFYQISPKHFEHIKNLKDTEFTKIMWLIDDGSPLVVKESPSFYVAVRLCRSKSFILVKENNNYENLNDLNVFQKLSDLQYCQPEFNEITTNFACSISGRIITLDTLIRNDVLLANVITASDLVRLVACEPYVLDQVEEQLPHVYIDRCLRKNIIAFKYLFTVSKQTLVLISGVSKQEEVVFKNFNLIHITDSSRESDSSGKQKLYISREVCSREKFRELHNKNVTYKNFHHLKLDQGKLEWVTSIGDVVDLEQFCVSDDLLVEEIFITDDCHNNINVVIGDPGMGKSVLIQKLKNSFRTEYLTLIVTPGEMRSLCTAKKEFDDVILNLIFPKVKKFDLNIMKYLIKTGEVVYLWDALDEISDEERSIIMDRILKLSHKSKLQLVTSRRHLKANLQHKFGVLAKEMCPFDEDQQKMYIERRLKSQINQSELETITKKIRGSVSILSEVDILSIPLQIYMLTELHIKNREKCNSLLQRSFPLTDLYKFFIEEKFTLYFKEKADSDDINSKICKTFKSSRITNYQQAALKLLFGDNLDKSEFLLEIIRDGDCVGLITEVKEQNNMLPEFIHISYAEYFAASFCINNFDKYQNRLFDRQHTNVRFFFDTLLAEKSPTHLAVLCKNLKQLRQNKDKLEQRDALGRHVLQLACTWAERYPLLEVTPVERFFFRTNAYIIDDDVNYSTSSPSPKYQQILHYLLNNCQIEDTDALLEYAEKSECIFVVTAVVRKTNSSYLNSKDYKFICNLLYYSVKYDFVDALDALTHTTYYIRDKNDDSLLHIASRNNSFKTLEKLLCQKIYTDKIDSPNKNGETPLFLAAYFGYTKLVEILGKCGADVETKDEFDQTSLFWACAQGRKDTAETLIKLGAKVDSKNVDGLTPLHTTCAYGHLEIVKILVCSGTEINSHGENGSTPLHSACQYGHPKIVKYLLQNGSNINAATKTGATPLFMACQEGHLEVVKLLLEKNAEINTPKKNGVSPLFIACHKGHQKVTKFLIFHGADVESAIHWATENNYLDIVRLLKESVANR